MAQIISIIDAYGYVPMVRQVFANRVFGPRIGRPIDEEAIRSGIRASERILNALEALVESDDFPIEHQLSLADLHLAPMMAYFTMAREGRAQLEQCPKLLTWWESILVRHSFTATLPILPE